MSPAEAIPNWLPNRGVQILSAMDAPLGWPAPVAQSLPNHNAGDFLTGTENAFFRRETDRFIRERIGKQSLNVDADRIARTAPADFNFWKPCAIFIAAADYTGLASGVRGSGCNRGVSGGNLGGPRD